MKCVCSLKPWWWMWISQPFAPQPRQRRFGMRPLFWSSARWCNLGEKTWNPPHQHKEKWSQTYFKKLPLLCFTQLANTLWSSHWQTSCHQHPQFFLFYKFKQRPRDYAIKKNWTNRFTVMFVCTRKQTRDPQQKQFNNSRSLTTCHIRNRDFQNWPNLKEALELIFLHQIAWGLSRCHPHPA